MTSSPAVITTAALELTAVSISYERAGQSPLRIVDDLGLDLRGGSLHCVAGRSGSGKTSLLRVAAGLMPPASGDVRWGGESLLGLTDDAISIRRRSTLGYLDQAGTLIPALTALENVLVPAVPGRRTAEFAPAAAELMDTLGIWQLAGSRPAVLSGGERQRVALARALLLDPPVIIVDEPTASLDRESADAVIAILRTLARRGKAVLVASHDARVIDVADAQTVLV